MKKTITFFLLALILSVGITIAQDTIIVEPGLRTLHTALEDEANNGKVFKLKRGGIYIIEYDLTGVDEGQCIIIGEKEPASMKPAMIQRFGPAGSASGKILYQGIASYTKFENIAFYCYSDNAESYFSAASAGGGVFEVNNCFIDGTRWGAIDVKGGADLKLTNNIFMNSIARSMYQQGHLISGDGADVADIIGIKVYNNSMINFGGQGTAGVVLADTAIYKHNTFYLIDRDVNSDVTYGQVNRIIHDNIVVDGYARGYVGPRTSWDAGNGYEGDNGVGWLPSPVDTVESIFGIDSLYLKREDSLSWKGEAEDNRLISIKNNLKYTSAILKAHHATITATTIPLFNVRTLQMFDIFDNKINEGNINETVDPNFIKGLPDIAYAPFFANNYQLRDVSARTEEYPVRENWDYSESGDFARVDLLVWPIPLNLKPQAAEAATGGTDGYPLGDLNWWGKGVVADWEAGKIFTPPSSVNDIKNNTNSVLAQNYPNPFSSSTTIVYEISKIANVSLIIYDVTGKKVETLVNKSNHQTGIQEVKWNVNNSIQSGIYFYQLNVGNTVTTKKMMLRK